MRRVTVFDTPLRDGEQAPGASLSPHSKFLVARALADLGVDVLGAGFPAASVGEAEAVARIAREVRGPTMAALARASAGDVDAAAKALTGALRSRIHVFIATSDRHLERKLRISRYECLERITAAVARATELADEVEFSAEDATRSDVDFLNAAYQAAAGAGARTMNIPDTVGYSQPQEFAALVLAVRSALASFSRLSFSVHCHNDLGLAVANTLAAIDAGVEQAHVTVNGLGERGGNASLEETVMALRTRTDHYRADTAVKAERLVATSRLVSELTGIPVQPNKAVVGANAFAHASGIHQDGVLKDPLNYEIMTPDSVGWNSRRIVVTRLSGRHGLAARFQELGIAMDRETLDRAYGLAMDHSAVAPELDDRMLIAIAAQARRAGESAAATPAD